MIYLPAAAGRTTRRMRRVGVAAAVAAGVQILAIIGAELSALAGHDIGPHRSLYAGAVLAAVVSASCLSFAYARELIASAVTAACADRARTEETLRQLVAELARMRATVRDVDIEVRAMIADQAVVTARISGEVTRLVRDELPAAVRRAEARGYVAGVRQRLADRGRPGRPHPMRPE